MIVLVAGAAAALVAAGSVRLLRSSAAGGRPGRSAVARGGDHVATGGLGVLGGLLIASSFSARLDARELEAVLVALAAGAAGALVERRTLPPSAGLPVAAVAGAALVALGVRSTAIGVDVADAVLTVAWVVVVTAALQRLDDARGAAAAVAAPAAAGFAVLAALADQSELAVVTGGLAAALGAVGLVGRRPPRIRLGRSGATATGVTLAAAAVLLEPATERPLATILALTLLALPLSGWVVVVVGRLRHGGALTGRQGDDLVGRLRQRGLHSRSALLVLVISQAVVSASVVAVDRGWVAGGAGVAVSLAVALTVTGVAAGGRVHDDAGSDRSVLRALAVGAVAVTAVLLVVTGASVMLAVGDVDIATAAAERGLEASRAGAFDEATVAFGEAQAAFDDAGGRLGGALLRPALLVPVLGRNLAAARDLAELGASLATAGAGVADAAPARLEVRAGMVPVTDIRASAPALAEAATSLRTGREALTSMDRTYLLGPLRDAVDELDGRLARAAADAATAADAAEVVPAIFGADAPRRYFLAVQNNAELRATGGFIGSFGELVADGGRVRLESFERISVLNERGAPARPIEASEEFLARYERFDVDTTWQSINLSPDFPTVGRIIAAAYPASGGRPVDGVIAVDPVGLAALLRITGPIEVAGWPVPLTADNVVAVTLLDAYQELEHDVRVDFLGEVARATVAAVTTGVVATPTVLGAALGPAVDGGHVMAYMVRPEEQSFVEAVDAAWALSEVASDTILAVNQNAGANKIDYFLQRRLGYDVRLSPHGEDGPVDVQGTLTVAMENTAPAAGLDPYTIGPNLEGIVAGTNRTYLSVYTPHGVTAARIDGQPAAVESERELGRSVYSAFLDVASGATRTLALDVAGSAALTAGGWYELEVGRQPLLRADSVSVVVTAAPGWHFDAGEGGVAISDDGMEARFDGVLSAPTTLRLRLGPSAQRAPDDGP